MSSTMVVTMATSTPTPTLRTDAVACCPSCGYDIPPVETTQAELLDAQARIADLEAQVRLLNEKAAAAVDRWADYEDELTKLRAANATANAQPETPTAETQQSPVRASFLQTGTQRISQLLSPRKSTPNLQTEPEDRSSPIDRPLSSPGLPPPPPPPKDDPSRAEALLQALTREKSLRREAEGRLSATSKEVEELSAALFEQANEMVADERRARAALEERVGELEQKDMDKRRRLDRLEGAMGRIERVRKLLEDGPESEDDDME